MLSRWGKVDLLGYASRYGIRSIGIFGSVARGENRLDSDVDVFVDLEEADPFVMFDIREALQSLLVVKSI